MAFGGLAVALSTALVWQSRPGMAPQYMGASGVLLHDPSYVQADRLLKKHESVLSLTRGISWHASCAGARESVTGVLCAPVHVWGRLGRSCLGWQRRTVCTGAATTDIVRAGRENSRVAHQHGLHGLKMLRRGLPSPAAQSDATLRLQPPQTPSFPPSKQNPDCSLETRFARSPAVSKQ